MKPPGQLHSMDYQSHSMDYRSHSMDYLDFVIRLEPAPHGWRARVLESPQGEGHEVIDLVIDLDTWMRLWFSQAHSIRRSRALQTVSEATEEPNLEQLPSLLFRALFRGEALRLWDRSVGVAAPGGLRLHLRFDAGENALAPLLPLPWELAQDPLTSTFHGPSTLTPMLRYLEVPHARPGGELPHPLRILLVAPDPDGVPHLAVGEEARAIERAFDADGSVHIHRLPRACLKDLHEVLAQAADGFHILHFMGHGDFDPASGTGFLLFENEAKQLQRVSGRELAEQLQDFAHSLRLVVLNACHSGAQRGGRQRDPFAGTAAALVHGGLPAVVAMQLPISDAAAVVFARTFYHRLAAGQPVEVATAAGRSAIQSVEPRTFEWAIPALFSRLRDGRLFDPPSTREPLRERLQRLLQSDSDEDGEDDLQDDLQQLLRGTPSRQWQPVLIRALLDGPGRAARRAARLQEQLGPTTSQVAEVLPGARRWDQAPWPIETALYTVARHDPDLLPHSRRSLRRTLTRKPALRQLFLQHPAWRRLAAAVYGGLDPRTFHHEAESLTPHILDLLQSDASPETLLARLPPAVTTGSRDNSDSDLDDLHLARLALGETLSRAEIQHSRRALERLVDTLAVRAPGTATWLKILQTEPASTLDKLLPHFPDCRGLSRALLVLALGRQPSNESDVEKPRLAWLVRLLQHLRQRQDPMALYHLSVVLDTQGASLTVCPDTLARAIAKAYGGASGLSTETPASASRIELGQALDGLALLPEALGFFTGWLLVALSRPMRATGLLPEALALATRLSDRLNAREDTLQRLLRAIGTPLLGRSAEAWLQHPRPHLALQPLADTLGSAWLRDRFLHRLQASTQRSIEEAEAVMIATDNHASGHLLLKSGIDHRWPVLSPVVVQALALDALASVDASRSDVGYSLRAVSSLGRPALHQLVKQWLQHREDDPQTALRWRRRFEAIEHDDADALETWADLAKDLHSPERDEALAILGNIQALRNNLASTLRQLLTSAVPAVRQALLRSLTYLLARRRLHDTAWREIAPALASLANEGVMDGQSFVLDGPGAVVAAVGAVRQRLAVPAAALSPVEAAQQAYDRWRHPWDAALRQPSDTLRRTLTAVGQEWLVSRRSRQEIEQAARRVALEPEVFTILLDWASHEMRRDVRQRNADDYLLGDLLSVLAGAAGRLPDQYHRHLETLPLWERQLCEAVRDADWFPTRRAALELLALLPQRSPRVWDVVNSARSDVPEVQDALERFEHASAESQDPA